MGWRIYLLLLLLATGSGTKAQDKAFDEAYDKIWKESAHKDLNASLADADSLYRSSVLPVSRMRCLMLIARLYQQSGDLDQSIEYALKIDKLAAEAGNYTWLARANGYLSGLYRINELYDKARSHSRKALAIIPKIKDPEQANSTKGLMLQELAYTAMAEENYREAISRLREAGQSIEKMQHNREVNTMSNEVMLGDNYRLLDRYDTAVIHYQRALTAGINLPSFYETGYAFRGMADSFLKQGDLQKAKEYLDKAERFADETKNLQLKDATHTLSKDYYARVKDQEGLAMAREKSNAVTDTLLNKRAHLLDKMYGQLEQNEITNKLRNDRKDVVIVVAFVLLVSAIVFFAWYKRKRRRELEQVKAVLERLSGNEVVPGPVEAATDFDETFDLQEKDTAGNQGSVEKRIMPPETERILLDRLAEFEKSGLFLENGFSLSSLATQLDSNTKYISYLVRKYKESDFNGYVNELRINFAIKMLRENPQWRQYKISALAAESGFSSHSQFAAVFKQQTGLPPSAFIRHLAEELE